MDIRMRPLLLVATMAILFAPLTAASPNPVPAMTIHLEPSSQTVNASVSPANATFKGEVQANITQYQTLSVALTVDVAPAWASSVTPANMTFTSSGSQAFAVNILVPADTTGVTGQLYINATGKTYLFTVTQTTAVLLIASGTPKPPANQTNATGQPSGTDSGNQTGSGGSGSATGGGLFGLSKENTNILISAIVAVAVFVVGAGAGLAIVRRKRRSRQMA